MSLKSKVLKNASEKENFDFSGRFYILLEKRLSGITGLRYTMLYGKCQNKLAEYTE